MVLFSFMISAVILTKNSDKTLKNTLESIKQLNEIIILDNGSTDKTIEIAKSYKNVKIHFSDFIGYGPLRNKGADIAKNNWILALDSDEALSEQLQAELKNISLNEINVYSFNFHNYFNNKLIKYCGWYPESHIRLYNKNKTHFSNSLVHEKLLDKGLNKISFQSPINHYSYQNLDDFLKKMSHYSTLFANQNKNKKDSSLLKAIAHSLFAFFKSYIIKKGIFGGKEGFIISLYNANTALYKYLKLEEINKK